MLTEHFNRFVFFDPAINAGVSLIAENVNANGNAAAVPSTLFGLQLRQHETRSGSNFDVERFSSSVHAIAAELARAGSPLSEAELRYRISEAALTLLV